MYIYGKISHANRLFCGYCILMYSDSLHHCQWTLPWPCTLVCLEARRHRAGILIIVCYTEFVFVCVI